MKQALQIFLACTVFCFSCVTFVAQSQSTIPGGKSIAVPGQWTTKANLPAERLNHASVVLGGKIYVFGGSGMGGSLNETYIYDIALDTWTTAPTTATLPVARISLSAEAVNGKIYLIGGYSQLAPLSISASVFEFDPATSRLTTKANMPLPVAGAASFVSNNKIFILGGSGKGGWNTDEKDTVQIYDPASNTWSIGSKMPYAARSFAAAFLGDQVVLAGGYTKNATPMVKSAYVGKIVGETITWTAVDDYPAGEINRLSAGASDSKIYFSGGQLQTGSATTPKTYTFNLASNKWEALQDNPNAVHSSSAILYDGSAAMFVIGGRTSTAPAVNTVSTLLTVTKPNMVVDAEKVVAKLMLNRSKKSSITIMNTGSGLLTWTAAAEPASEKWIKLSGTGGDVQPDHSALLNVSIDTKGMTAGTYNATIKLISNDAQHPSKDIPVTLFLQSEPSRDKRVLLEEFTGTWCGWCPYGVDSIHAMLARYGNELVVISHHYNDAMSILSNSTIVYYLKGKYFPGGTMDRTKFPAEADTIIDRGAWGLKLDEILTATPQAPIGISFLEKNYNPANKQMSCKVQVKFFEAVAKPTKITLVQTESGQNYLQKLFGNPAITEIYPFYHEHVVRQMIPDVFGEVLTDAPMLAGSSVEHQFSFTSVDSVWANSELVVIVEENAGSTIGPVLQVYDEGLVDGIEGISAIEPRQAPTEYALQNYPNPLSAGVSGNAVTTISYSLPKSSAVRITIFDMLGRQVATLVNEIKEAGSYTAQWNAHHLNAGIYLCKYETGSATITRKMTVVK